MLLQAAWRIQRSSRAGNRGSCWSTSAARSRSWCCWRASSGSCTAIFATRSGLAPGDAHGVMFGALVIAPLVIVYLFSLDFINRGIDSWFRVEIRQGLNDAVVLSRSALDLRLRDRHGARDLLRARCASCRTRAAAAAGGGAARHDAAQITVYDAYGRAAAVSSATPLAQQPRHRRRKWRCSWRRGALCQPEFARERPVHHRQPRRRSRTRSRRTPAGATCSSITRCRGSSRRWPRACSIRRRIWRSVRGARAAENQLPADLTLVVLLTLLRRSTARSTRRSA